MVGMTKERVTLPMGAAAAQKGFAQQFFLLSGCFYSAAASLESATLSSVIPSEAKGSAVQQAAPGNVFAVSGSHADSM
jgi:hypothetical protein